MTDGSLPAGGCVFLPLIQVRGVGEQRIVVGCVLGYTHSRQKSRFFLQVGPFLCVRFISVKIRSWFRFGSVCKFFYGKIIIISFKILVRSIIYAYVQYSFELNCTRCFKKQGSLIFSHTANSSKDIVPGESTVVRQKGKEIYAYGPTKSVRKKDNS